MGRSSACVENVREFSRARDSHLLTPLFSHQNFSPSKVLVCVDEIDVLVVLSKLREQLAININQSHTKKNN